jgi:hypothetical protein
MGKSSIKCSRVPPLFVNSVRSVYTHEIFILPRNLEHASKQTELNRSISLKDGGLLVPGYTTHPGTTPELFPEPTPTKGKKSQKVNGEYSKVPGKIKLISLFFSAKTGYTSLIRGFPIPPRLMCSGFKPKFSHLLKNINGGCYVFHY